MAGLGLEVKRRPVRLEVDGLVVKSKVCMDSDNAVTVAERLQYSVSGIFCQILINRH
jgi:hypothetical protein